MSVGFGLLGLASKDFWAMTPRELAAAIRGRIGPQLGGPPSKGDVIAIYGRMRASQPIEQRSVSLKL